MLKIGDLIGPSDPPGEAPDFVCQMCQAKPDEAEWVQFTARWSYRFDKDRDYAFEGDTLCPRCAQEHKTAQIQSMALAEFAEQVRDFERKIPRKYTWMKVENLQKGRRDAMRPWITFKRRTSRNWSLLIWGAPGTGKTAAIYVMLRCYLRKAIQQSVSLGPVLVVYVPDLLAEIRLDAVGNNRKDMTIQKHTGILVLDDLGTGKPTDFAREVIERIIHYRELHALPTIATSNLPLGATPGYNGSLADQWSERIVRRFDEAIVVEFEGKPWLSNHTTGRDAQNGK